MAMEVISNICGVLVIAVTLIIPILLFVLLILRVLKKRCLWAGVATLCCVGSFVPLILLGTLTSPQTWCQHEYDIIEEVAPTCNEKGKIVKHCPLCDMETTERLDKLTHQWVVKSSAAANCENGGYVLQECSTCFTTQKTDETAALGHSMKEISNREPTYEVAGEKVKKCDKCGHEEVETIAKLDPIIIKFDGLELVFGQYTFDQVDNSFSEYNGQYVVKIPVTIKNLSKDPNTLTYFEYKLFGASGIESPDMYVYFSDDVAQGGNLLSGNSYVKYFHILYDGDGVYTIVFDNFLLDKKTVEITVKK